MAKSNADSSIENIILQASDDEEKIIQQLDKFIKENGPEEVKAWRNKIDKNTLIHEMVKHGHAAVIRHLACQYNFELGIHREKDGKTPLELAEDINNDELVRVLQELDKDQSTPDNIDEDVSDVSDKKRKMNIVWLDLEMTSIEEPKIMECAVIITDKFLEELKRDEWVVHYEKEELDKLEPWHQKHFKSTNDGGNGLFDDCLRSKLTEKDVEDRLFDLLQRYCPEKECCLAGSSVHIDKEVLKARMPRVHNYLHYRIIDVSSFRAMLKRWAPKTDSEFTDKLATMGKEIVNHRAMNDIEYSIQSMKLFEPLFRGRPARPKRYRDDVPNKNARYGKEEAPSASSINRGPRSFPADDAKLYADEKALKERLDFEKIINRKSLGLDQKSLLIYNRNPHLRELFTSGKIKINVAKNFTNENRFLNLRTPADAQRVNGPQYVTTEHWGTRKLLLTDIEFLTNYSKGKEFTVLYFGAAPGIHINYLSVIFPKLNFVLIDKKNVETRKSEKIHIRSLEYIDDIVKEYSKSRKDILLISDIHSFSTQDDMDAYILKDIENQVFWHQAIKPAASLLTFQFPNRKSRVKYLAGELLIEPWATRRVHSCRLVVEDGARSKEYEIKEIKTAMSYFQNVLRTNYYEHDLPDSDRDGLDHCYDCRSEIFILRRYLEMVQKLSRNYIENAISSMSQEISPEIQNANRPSFIDGNRTLAIIPKK